MRPSITRIFDRLRARSVDRANTRLLNAALRGDVKGVQCAVDSGADLRRFGEIAIEDAVFARSETIVSILINHGANPRGLDRALTKAISRKDQETIAFTLELGATVTARMLADAYALRHDDSRIFDALRAAFKQQLGPARNFV